MIWKNHFPTLYRWAIFLTAIAVLVLMGSELASGGGAKQYQVGLTTGGLDGYRWATGAKGLKHEPLGEICSLASLVEPPKDGVDFVEGTDATVCGRLRTPKESVIASPAFGSGESRFVILAAIYRPVVHKVVFLLDTGQRKVYRPRLAKVPDWRAMGIPRFRYVAAPFQGETCIRKVTTFDGVGSLIYGEERPPCRQGGNL